MRVKLTERLKSGGTKQVLSGAKLSRWNIFFAVGAELAAEDRLFVVKQRLKTIVSFFLKEIYYKNF